jgi:hypothetical protein
MISRIFEVDQAEVGRTDEREHLRDVLVGEAEG